MKLTRGAVLLFSLLVASLKAVDAAPSEKGSSTVSAHVFAPTSFWYAPIPADAPLHPNSANFVAEFLRQKKAYYGTVAINTTSYASPVYVVGPEVKPVVVTPSDCQKKGHIDKGLTEQWSAVPVPEYAEAATGTDAEMTVYQPSSDTIWEFWKAKKSAEGKWEACWGGRMQNVSKSNGIWPKYYGTTATGLPFLGGQLTVEEMQRGEINHVMGISIVDAEKGFVWPANRSDGGNPKNAPNWIPEGTRFRLDPTVNVDALNMHPIGKAVAKAAQKYGFVVWDKAGAITLRAENPKAYTTAGKPNPYTELWGKTPSWAILQGFPWGKLQFLPADYGKPK